MKSAFRSLPPRLTADPPGPRSRALADRLGRVESRNVTFLADDFPIFWDRAEGSNVWDADGNRYVDLTAGFGVAAVGHRHPRVLDAVRAQGARLLHGMGDVHPPVVKVELLERLAALAPQPEARTVLATSGSEAVEVALKTAHLHTGKPGVVAFTGAYHGLTYGALAVTDRAYFRAPFERQLNPFVLRAAYPHPFRPPPSLLEKGPSGDGPSDPSGLGDAALARLEALLESDAGRRVGAVIVEPIQGRAGEVVPPAGFLPGLARLCRDRGILLVADEIFTGCGRTGRMFACLEEEVVPDLLCVGKALSGGMPLAACIGTGDAMDAWPVSRGEAMHTSTFQGHPLACAAALAALEVIRGEGLAERARAEGARWIEALRSMAARHPGVGDVRGRGLMVGVEIVKGSEGGRPDGDRAARLLIEALQRGWIVLLGGAEANVVSLTPPLTMEPELLDAAVEALDGALAATAAA